MLLATTKKNITKHHTANDFINFPYMLSISTKRNYLISYIRMDKIKLKCCSCFGKKNLLMVREGS